MPTPTKGPRLGSGPAHERLLLAGLATQLFEHRSITTTEAKAKRLRPLAERMVTFAKRGDLAARRRVLSTVRDKGVVHALFTEIGPAMAERPGGYTRITKIGPRKGDNAPMAVIELVMEPVTARAATVREAEAATARASRGNTPAPAAVAPGAADEAPVAPSTEAGSDAAVTSSEASVDDQVGGADAGETTDGETTDGEITDGETTGGETTGGAAAAGDADATAAPTVAESAPEPGSPEAGAQDRA